MYCVHLKALRGFAWLIWCVLLFATHCYLALPHLLFLLIPPHRILVTFAIIAVLICGIVAAHKRDGYDGGLVSV